MGGEPPGRGCPEFMNGLPCGGVWLSGPTGGHPSLLALGNRCTGQMRRHGGGPTRCTAVVDLERGLGACAPVPRR
ncbi:hypothetical protein SFR_3907 [Streptomyces sp. FR-008]|nr:hypothetical protein SFR_3907 [Streptomyces sp. FR-008]